MFFHVKEKRKRNKMERTTGYSSQDTVRSLLVLLFLFRSLFFYYRKLEVCKILKINQLYRSGVLNLLVGQANKEERELES